MHRLWAFWRRSALGVAVFHWCRRDCAWYCPWVVCKKHKNGNGGWSKSQFQSDNIWNLLIGPIVSRLFSELLLESCLWYPSAFFNDVVGCRTRFVSVRLAIIWWISISLHSFGLFLLLKGYSYIVIVWISFGQFIGKVPLLQWNLGPRLVKYDHLARIWLTNLAHCVIGTDEMPRLPWWAGRGSRICRMVDCGRCFLLEISHGFLTNLIRT